MNYKQRLTGLLCEVEEIKEDVMELRVGCEFIDEEWDECLILDGSVDIKNLVYSTWCWDCWACYSIKEILWNPIEERHLRMYCEENDIFLSIDSDWSFWTLKHNHNIYLWKLHYNKPFSEQTEEVYEKILEIGSSEVVSGLFLELANTFMNSIGGYYAY